MPDTELHQPGLGLLRAVAGAAELAQAASGLATACGYGLAGSDPLTPLARAVARSLTGAGPPLRHCARHVPRCRLGGICLLPVLAGPVDARAGIAVPWTAQSLISLDWDRFGTCTGIQQAMNTAIGGILPAFGHPAELFGPGGAWFVTSHCGQDPGAGR
jgi:hypothetical protein